MQINFNINTNLELSEIKFFSVTLATIFPHISLKKSFCYSSDGYKSYIIGKFEKSETYAGVLRKHIKSNLNGHFV